MKKTIRHWWKKWKTMQTDGMISDSKNQYSESDYILPKAIHWLKAILIKLPTVFLHRTRTNNFKTCIETQSTLNSWGNLEKEEWKYRNQPSWLQTILQINSHQDSMVLAQRQKYRPVEQDGKPMHLWSPYLWQRRQKYTMD